MLRHGSAWVSRPASVVLPAPEGEESTSSRPRLSIRSSPEGGLVSLNVLHLLSHLIDHRLQLQAGARRLFVIGFGAKRVGLAVELLRQKIEPTSGRRVEGHEVAGGRDVADDAL